MCQMGTVSNVEANLQTVGEGRTRSRDPYIPVLMCAWQLFSEDVSSQVRQHRTISTIQNQETNVEVCGNLGRVTILGNLILVALIKTLSRGYKHHPNHKILSKKFTTRLIPKWSLSLSSDAERRMLFVFSALCTSLKV